MSPLGLPWGNMTIQDEREVTWIKGSLGCDFAQANIHPETAQTPARARSFASARTGQCELEIIF